MSSGSSSVRRGEAVSLGGRRIGIVVEKEEPGGPPPDRERAVGPGGECLVTGEALGMEGSQERVEWMLDGAEVDPMHRP